MNIASRTNLTWTVFVLLACLIGTLSVKWASVEDLPGIISLALSLASLVLAVIAIVQTLTSSDGMSRSLADVSRAAEKAALASEKVENAGAELVAHAKDLARIPSHLAEMKESIEGLSVNAAPQATPDPTDLTKDADGLVGAGDITTKMLAFGTNGTELALYLGFKYLKAGVPLNAKEVVGFEIGEYYNAVFATLIALDLIEAEIYDNGKIKIENMKDFDELETNKFLAEDDTPFVVKTKSLIDEFFSKKSE